MKKITSFFLLYLFIQSVAFGQWEQLTPVGAYTELLSQPKTQSVQRTLPLAKTAQQSIFPITEHFFTNSPDTNFWTDKWVTVQNGFATFNALDTVGATYANGNGTFGETDVFTSRFINALDIQSSTYLAFAFEKGTTWQAGDSLVLYAKNAAGNWNAIWQTPAAYNQRVEVYVDFTLNELYTHAALQFKWVSFSNRNPSNNATFQLDYFVFGPKPSMPYYENIKWVTATDSRLNWSRMDGAQRRGYGLSWGDVLMLDVANPLGGTYTGNHFDTIQSHAFATNSFSLSDSVYLRFYYRAITNQPNDSIILEYKNNVGVWVRQWGVRADQAQGWRKYVDVINKGRFYHGSFQYRLVTKGTIASQADSVKWVMSGFHIGKKLQIPFIDDFSTTTVYPDEKKWKEQLVFVNNRFPIRPPSLNVATFDGLNRVGAPHGFGRGYCDTLTSWPIKLDGLTQADSVYLSFFIQPKGLGVIPDRGDTLSLFVRYTDASTDSFRLLWRAAPQGLPTNTFTQVRILLPNDLLHDDFQLRFINKGSKTGNLNHWHLDYVYLNKGRNANDAITDIAIQETPSPLLFTYSSLPYAHFKNASNTLTRDTQYFSVRNNSNLGYAIDYGREIFDHQWNRIDSFGTVISVFPAQTEQIAAIKKNINLNLPTTDDSVTISSRFYTRLGTTFDNIRSNDTVWTRNLFDNYYAYDDGTAEAGYALLKDIGKVALRYQFVRPDSLYGIAVHFNRGVQDVSSFTFNFMIWKQIAPTEELLLSVPGKAVYYNARNGFYYIKFEQPIWVENEVFIGWQQTQIFPLNVGFDLNYKVNDDYVPSPNLFYNIGGIWQPTELWGALMMRAIVGKWKDPAPVGLNKPQVHSMDVQVYPNPTQGKLYLSGDDVNAIQQITLYDLSGRLLHQQRLQEKEITLPEQLNGLYLFELTHNNGSRKIIKLLIQP